MSAIKVYARGWRFKLPVSGLFCVYGVFSDGGGAGSGGEQGGVFADLRFDAGGAVRVFGEVLFDGFAALDAAAFHGKPRACLVDDAEIAESVRGEISAEAVGGYACFHDSDPFTCRRGCRRVLSFYIITEKRALFKTGIKEFRRI